MRFSLRTLFVLVTVLGVPLCLLGYQIHWIRQRREFMYRDNVVIYAEGIQRAPSCLWLLGERGADEVYLYDASLERDASRLFPEAQLFVN